MSWFQQWVSESYSIRQLALQKGISSAKLRRVKDYFLKQDPEGIWQSHPLSSIEYIQVDGTYFHKDGCLFLVIAGESQKVIGSRYVPQEDYESSHALFKELKERGLMPVYAALDGHRQVRQALEAVWPEIKIQRCLYHIQREGMRWLRTYPKTQAGKELRVLLRGLCGIKSKREREEFKLAYAMWKQNYWDFVKSLPASNIGWKDLKKTISLLDRAMPEMFQYLEDERLDATTNKLESIFSRLKADYRRHRGLTQSNKIQYLKWYCYFHNLKISNTL